MTRRTVRYEFGGTDFTQEGMRLVPQHTTTEVSVRRLPHPKDGKARVPGLTAREPPVE